MTKLFGWWYVVLGLSFAALAWRSALLGAPRLGIGLRALIALGFAALGFATLRTPRR